VKKSVTPATIGALVRNARIAAGMSQSELGLRIGASRFWVAQFEKGKPSAELGLALRALDALDLGVNVEPRETADASKRPGQVRGRARRVLVVPGVDLRQIIETSTSATKVPSRAGWPAASAGRTSRRS